MLKVNPYYKDGEFIYYKGMGSGTVYKRPFNKKAWEMAEKAETLTEEEIRKLNNWFIKHSKNGNY